MVGFHMKVHKDDEINVSRNLANYFLQWSRRHEHASPVLDKQESTNTKIFGKEAMC